VGRSDQRNLRRWQAAFLRRRRSVAQVAGTARRPVASHAFTEQEFASAPQQTRPISKSIIGPEAPTRWASARKRHCADRRSDRSVAAQVRSRRQLPPPIADGATGEGHFDQFADDPGQSAMPQPFFHRRQHFGVLPGLAIDHAIRMLPNTGEPGREQTAAVQTKDRPR
jgi:hypothetical protein